MNKIIAVVGMCGAGKSVVCEHLESLGYKKIYFGGVTLDILKEEGLEINPENEKVVRERLRKEHGMAAYAIFLLPKIRELSKDNNVVLDGLYSWDELMVLQKEFSNIKVISVITDKSIRYDRLAKREVRPLTNEEANKRDIAEIENLAKGGPICYADYFVLNNNSREDTIKRVNEILNILEGDNIE